MLDGWGMRFNATTKWREQQRSISGWSKTKNPTKSKLINKISRWAWQKSIETKYNVLSDVKYSTLKNELILSKPDSNAQFGIRWKTFIQFILKRKKINLCFLQFSRFWNAFNATILMLMIMEKSMRSVANNSRYLFVISELNNLPRAINATIIFMPGKKRPHIPSILQIWYT